MDLLWCLIIDHLLRYTFGVLITWSSINNGFLYEYTQNCTFKIKDEATAFKIFVYILSSYCGLCFRCATNISPVDIEYWTMEMKRNHLLTTQIVLLCTFLLFAFVGCVTRISTASTTFIFDFSSINPLTATKQPWPQPRDEQEKKWNHYTTKSTDDFFDRDTWNDSFVPFYSTCLNRFAPFSLFSHCLQFSLLHFYHHLVIGPVLWKCSLAIYI